MKRENKTSKFDENISATFFTYSSALDSAPHDPHRFDRVHLDFHCLIGTEVVFGAQRKHAKVRALTQQEVETCTADNKNETFCEDAITY